MLDVRKYNLKKHKIRNAELLAEERAARLQRAFTTHGKGLEGITSPVQLSPARQISLLENYIAELEDLAGDLHSNYGELGFSNEVELRKEREDAINQILDLKIGLIKPKTI
jgi:hypothetical protein